MGWVCGAARGRARLQLDQRQRRGEWNGRDRWRGLRHGRQLRSRWGEYRRGRRRWRRGGRGRYPGWRWRRSRWRSCRCGRRRAERCKLLRNPMLRNGHVLRRAGGHGTAGAGGHPVERGMYAWQPLLQRLLAALPDIARRRARFLSGLHEDQQVRAPVFDRIFVRRVQSLSGRNLRAALTSVRAHPPRAPASLPTPRCPGRLRAPSGSSRRAPRVTEREAPRPSAARRAR